MEGILIYFIGLIAVVGINGYLAHVSGGDEREVRERILVGVVIYLVVIFVGEMIINS